MKEQDQHLNDFSFISSNDAKNYMTDILNSVTHSTDLECKYPNFDPELVKILVQMLEFNPFFRPSAKQLLKSKLFDDFRIKKNEVGAPAKIYLTVDKELES